ncbi:MAG: type VII secretion protein EssC [Mogibacterium sp.]|nr:type VII secretion protein EssC [Mogibacterium sp.]
MIILIHNEVICKEILLPNSFDTDMVIELGKEDYGLSADVNLMLENRNGIWYLMPGSDYEILRMGRTLADGSFEDGAVSEIKSRAGDLLYLVASLNEMKLKVADKYSLKKVKTLTIGSKPDNYICYKFQNLVSSHHLHVTRDENGWIATDTSSNGVFRDHRRVRGKFRLEFGDHLNIFGLHLIFLQNHIFIGVNCGDLTVDEKLIPKIKVGKNETVLSARREHSIQYFNRAPRDQNALYREKVEIEAPPQPSQSKQKPAYLIIGPAFSMAIPMLIGCLMMIFASHISKRAGNAGGSSPFIFMGLTIAVGAAIVGAVWAILNMRYDKQQRIAEEEVRFNSYSNYLIGIAQKLREYYNYNTAAMNKCYPSSAECLSYTRNSPQLWNRNTTHEDFLFQRIGLGEQDFQVQIEIPKDRFSLIEDSLQDRPAQIKQEFRKLNNVPVGISLLAHNLIGIIGNNNYSGAISVMQSMVAGIAASHSYSDVKLVFLYDEKDKTHLADWECMKWLPHVWSEDRKIRFMAGNDLERSEVLFHIANVIRARAEQKNYHEHRGEIPKPYYIIFVSNPRILEGEVLTKYIYDKSGNHGITTVLMAESQQQLPNSCDMIIGNDNYFSGIINLASEATGSGQPLALDRVDRQSLVNFGRRLANISIKEVEVNTEIPDSLNFLEMYGAKIPEELKIEERWRKNRTYNSLKAPVGKKAGGQDCYLDIHEKHHGPHGLVAGTTGSGKSETLQTYILSLAVNYSPADVAFFVIDYKGGGMANLFSDLPHLAGKISNLSGNQIHRAMISIKSENLRRQRLFAQYGVNHINEYTKLYKEHQSEIPLPHLIIIIDEFAELKKEEPDFMRELISVTQVGRSLGVHLILATQKPAGTVDDNIQANSKFRLCLRVQDRQDSIDMLHRPDAAYLTQAGRCYMQIGNDEIFELFQSGYSGAIYTGEGRISSVASMIGRTGRTELLGKSVSDIEKSGSSRTEMEAVIEHMKHVSSAEGYAASMQLWLPVLGNRIIMTVDEKDWWKRELDSERLSLIASVGTYDDPSNQAQGELSFDFTSCGHIAVCGNIVSGKSTFMQTLMYSLITGYSPERVQSYIVDFSSRMMTFFENAPHVGGVVTDDQPDRLSKLFVLLNNLMDERKQILKGGNFVQYANISEHPLPAIFVMIDNFASFREKTDDRYEATITRLVREGVSYGIFLVVSAAGFGMSDIPNRIGDHINTVVSLEQQDKYKYMEVLRQSRLQIIPDSGIKGRGMALVGDRVLEFQTALCDAAEDDYSRGQAIEKMSMRMRDMWGGALPRPIPEIPENPTMEIFSDNPEYKTMLGDNRYIPIGYNAEDASVYSFDLLHHYCFAVTGKARSGRTTILRSIIKTCRSKGAEVAILESKKDYSRLEQDAISLGCRYAGDNAEVYKFFSDLIPEFSARNRKKQDLLKAGYSEEEAAKTMLSEKPIFIFVDDLSDLIHMAYKPEAGVGSISGFLENILEKGKNHAIYFFAGLKIEDEIGLSAYKAYLHFTSYKRGLLLGGNPAGQKLLQFQNIPFAEQSKIRKKGIALVSDDEEDNVGREIVIPVP